MPTPFCDNRVSTDWSSTPTDVVARVELEPATATASAYRVHLVDASGRELINRSYPFVPLPVPKRAIDSIKAAWDSVDARRPNRWVHFARTVKPMANYPPIRRIVSGRDGTVWLEERIEGAGHQWRILDSNGSIAGTVSLPEDVSLEVADMRNIWGYETDADGLQGIVRYRVGPTKR